MGPKKPVTEEDFCRQPLREHLTPDEFKQRIRIITTGV